jgi:hypothetical protein
MGAFGWSLPAGCGTLPGEEEPYLFPQQEAAATLLQDAGVDPESEAARKIDEIIGQLCLDLADLRKALGCAARMKAVVRFEATELSTTSGFVAELSSSDPETVATSFVQLMKNADEE